MTKKIKHLIAIGAVSVITLGAAVPASAQTIYNKTTCPINKKNYIKVVVNKRLNCSIKDMIITGNIWDNIVILPGGSNDNNTVKPEEKPEQNPSETPSVPGDSNDNNTVKPEEKPEQNPSETPSVPGDSNDNNTVKPEEKPNETPSVPEDSNNNDTVKPEEKPEQNPGTSNDFAAFQQKVLQLVNAERAKVGAKPLTLNAKLSNVATTKSQDMINKNYFDHNSPTYGSPFDMMKQFGISYKTAGENIAMGQTSPEEVMKSWMNSSGHRKNILSTSFTEIGVGIAKNAKGQLYWTQMFIGN